MTTFHLEVRTPAAVLFMQSYCDRDGCVVFSTNPILMRHFQDEDEATGFAEVLGATIVEELQ